MSRLRLAESLEMSEIELETGGLDLQCHGVGLQSGRRMLDIINWPFKLGATDLRHPDETLAYLESVVQSASLNLLYQLLCVVGSVG